MSNAREYYSVLLRATSALDREDARRAIYDRAHLAITDANLPPSDVARERAALEAAIERLESERRAAARTASSPRSRSDVAPDHREDAAHRPAPQRTMAVRPQVLARIGVVVVALLAVLGYALWPRSTVEDRGSPGKQAVAPAGKADTSPNETVNPGRSFIFNRQVVYYRSIHPEGTIVIAKSQRYLYLVRPNVTALRYTIGVGRECANVVGLLPVSAKEDWPETPTRTADVHPSAKKAGGETSRSRFGLHSLALGDTGHRIHGTYAANTDGDGGCFVLVNNDITDLYQRIPVGTRVVIN